MNLFISMCSHQIIMSNATGPHVVKCDKVYRGKTYSQWIPEWCNWFYMIDPDQYNGEPWNDVKFLRSFPSPEKIAKLDPTQKIQYEGSAMYRNLPNVMMGSDRIVMYDDQAIFFPVMLAIWIASDPTDEYGEMERWVKEQNSHSDDPAMSYQFTIDGKILVNSDGIPFNSDDILKYKIDSSGTFSLRIPEADYGKSLNDFVFKPSPPGWHQAYCQGYFFMVEGFKPRAESYFIFSMARGAPYAAGEYYASFAYEIKVIPSYLRPRSSQSGNFPEKIMNNIKNEIISRKEKKEIGEIEQDYWDRVIGYCRDTQDNFVQHSINNRKDAEFQSIEKFLWNTLKARAKMAKARNPNAKDVLPEIEKCEKDSMTEQKPEGPSNAPTGLLKNERERIDKILKLVKMLEDKM